MPRLKLLCHKAVISALLMLLTAGTWAEETDSVLDWALWPIPGAVNLVDGQPRDGIAMEALDLLMARLPELQPRYRLANRPRQQYDMEQGLAFCSMPLLRRADSDQIGYFIPFMASTPIQAVIRQDDRERFPLENGSLSLSRLLADTDLRGGVSGFRTYPTELAAWFSEAQTAGRLESVTGALSGENLLLMVSHGRLDFTFEFATVTRAITRRLAVQAPLLSLPIQEHRELVETGIYCTRSDWGRAMAARLDLAVRQIAAEPGVLLALYERWVPEETYQAFADELRAYYLQRAGQPTALP
mgnify:CR=1 FL=1